MVEDDEFLGAETGAAGDAAQLGVEVGVEGAQRLQMMTGQLEDVVAGLQIGLFDRQAQTQLEGGADVVAEGLSVLLAVTGGIEAGEGEGA